MLLPLLSLHIGRDGCQAIHEADARILCLMPSDLFCVISDTADTKFAQHNVIADIRNIEGNSRLHELFHPPTLGVQEICTRYVSDYWC